MLIVAVVIGYLLIGILCGGVFYAVTKDEWALDEDDPDAKVNMAGLVIFWPLFLTGVSCWGIGCGLYRMAQWLGDKLLAMVKRRGGGVA